MDHMKPKRTGLRVVTRKGVHRDVRRAVLRFAVWLRQRDEFPARLTVYLCAADRVLSSAGERGVSFSSNRPRGTGAPAIHAATGDYSALRKRYGNREDALCVIVCEVAEHFVNYQNWWYDRGWSTTAVRRRSDALMREYAADVKYII